MNVPCWTCDWVTAFGSVSGNTSLSPSYAIVRSIYVAEMWLSLSSCFYLVDNSARVNITRLHKYRASCRTGTRLNVKESIELDGKYRCAPFGFIVDEYTIQFTLSDILQKHGLAQCHCGNMSILFLTLFLSLSRSSYPLPVRSFC